MYKNFNDSIFPCSKSYLSECVSERTAECRMEGREPVVLNNLELHFNAQMVC